MSNNLILPVTRLAGRTSLKLKNANPTILFAVGIVGVVGGTVLACRATLKTGEIFDEAQNQLDDINRIKHLDGRPYTKTQQTKDRSAVYMDLVIDMGKIWGPSIVVGTIGIACLTGSHRILTKRNAALTAAYAALEKSYEAYRQRVRETFGEEAEQQFHYEVQKDLAEKEKELVAQAKKKGPKPGYSLYSKFFDEANPNWTRSPEQNLLFIHRQQSWANDMLHSRGHLFLNEVYDMLGIPRTTAGAVVGWTVYGEGDRHVDFGIYNHHTDEVKAFVNGYENSVLLDFNVDGDIHRKIER